MAGLEESYLSQTANLFLALVRYLLYPSYFSFNCLTSLYCPTFQEQKESSKSSFPLKRLVLTVLWAAMFVLLLPITALLLPLRCMLVSLRRPFRYSEHHSERTCLLEKTAQRAMAAGEYKFSIGSANICLAPEILSRMNHLPDVDYRSVNIGQRIKEDQFASHQMLLPSNGSPARTNGPQKLETEVSHVSTWFPQLDFLCLQEAWSSYHNKVLIEELHQSFPYIVHDVGVHAFNVNSFILNSGHLVASRHPIEAVDFKPYKNFVDHGKIISMGLTSVKHVNILHQALTELLSIQLQLGSQRSKGKNVAYVFNTHLQSYQGKHEIIPRQLDELLEYSQVFMAKTRRAEDNIAFCIVCGDFNMDNLSPADEAHTRHRIFELFEDFPRLKPGQDKPWAIGTEMRQDRMMDRAVSTPEFLKQAVEDATLRQCYLIDADITEHSKESLVYAPVKMDGHVKVRAVPEGGRRRIDYILYDKQYPVEVKGYQFVTRLASLTDHIPVAMEFTCSRLL
ncbi:hypothetical protein EGW08_015659 [Elysia chlorotica]|uniref:sphingomyelin phosphodiesterase n=1 Tax=Elysia chlorotica TaxID=188477 RepID=A0A433T4Y0_ELYCH|nr:hypothetical protein EGW08_015659 [Elysia chlorotica]